MDEHGLPVRASAFRRPNMGSIGVTAAEMSPRPLFAEDQVPCGVSLTDGDLRAQPDDHCDSAGTQLSYEAI
jgi:hypothetical protein